MTRAAFIDIMFLKRRHTIKIFNIKTALISIPIIFTCAFALAEEQLLYNYATKEDVKSEAAFLLRKVDKVDEKDPCAACLKPCDEKWTGASKSDATYLCQPKSMLSVSLLSTGRGAQFRSWLPERLVLVIGDIKLKPCDQSKFYVLKESIVKNAAVVAFVALGAMSKPDVSRAAENPGASCHATKPPETPKGSPVSRGIERAGLAAGLGLLTSQAKGELTGIKACFDVTGLEKYLEDATLTTEVVNESQHQKYNVAIPVKFEYAEFLPYTETLASTITE